MKRHKVPKKFYDLSPTFWGVCYFGAIPVFALIYWLLPYYWFGYGCETNSLSNLLNSIYFSTITITTLGYGDIYPVHYIAKFVVILESLLGIFAIGLFLNAVALRKSKIDAKAEKRRNEIRYLTDEKVKLRRQYVVIEPYLKTYVEYATMVSTPIKKRGSELNYNPDFDFHDLYDLYNPSLRLADNFTEPVISHFYKSLHNLEQRIETMLSIVDLSLWPDLENKLLSIIRQFRELDFESAILSYINLRSGNGPATIAQSDLIKNWKEEVKYYPSNAINSAVALYYLIKGTVPLVQEVDTQLLDISKSV